MARVKDFLTKYLHLFVVGGVALVCAFFLLIGHPSENGYITLDGSDSQISEGTKDFIDEAQKALITYSENAVPTIIINENGEEEVINAPTVEEVDGGKIPSLEDCPEGEICGLGSYVYAPTDTYQQFKDYTYGKCWNIDGFAGAQCWDLSSLHAMNYTKDKRVFSTCGTGAAKDMWTCKEVNAGTEYDLVFNVNELKVGDIAVFSGGTWGHTGIIAGPVINGYVALLGQNQGGASCYGGGAATNIINISVKNFLGAFRPKTYENPTPTPTPISKCESWDLVYGDTLGQIMLSCEGQITWGEAMNNYAKLWVDNLTGKTVWEGWNNGGVGLFAGHTITKK